MPVFAHRNIGVLCEIHANDVYALFKSAFARAPFGYLAPKSRADIHEILSDSEKNLSYGYFEGDRLIGYQLGNVSEMSAIGGLSGFCGNKSETTIFFEGRGVVVGAEFKARGIGLGLIAARKRVLQSCGLSFYTGLIDTRNISSMRAQLAHGHKFVRLEQDETSLNYRVLLPASALSDVPKNTVSVAMADLDAQATLFASGYSVVSATGKTDLIFSKIKFT